MSAQRVMDLAEPSTWRLNPVLPPLRQWGIKEIDYDTETTGLCWYDGDTPVGFVVGGAWGCQYIPIKHRGADNFDEAVVRRWMQTECRDLDIYGLNLKFDHQMTRNFGVDLERQGCRLHDLGHMGALLDEHAKRYSLESLGQRYLGEGKMPQLNKAFMAEMTAAQAGPYAEQDGRLTGRLKQHLKPLIAAERLEKVLDLEDRLIYAVCEMERNGLLIDEAKLSQWVRESEQELSKAEDELRALAGIRVNVDSGNQVNALFSQIGLSWPGTTTEKGEKSYADAVLKVVLSNTTVTARQRRCLELVRFIRKLGGLRSKYLCKYPPLVKKGIIRFSLHSLGQDDYGTVTGRFSAGGTIGGRPGFNPQQVFKPSKQRKSMRMDGFDENRFLIRELFIPPPGSRWVCADAKQIQFRLFAHYAALHGMPRLAEVYAQNPERDFHDLVVGLTGLGRDDAKNWNFMGLFGGGVGKAVEMTGLPRAVCEAQKAAYDREFPEVKTLLDIASALAERRGYVKDMIGRRRHYREQNPRFYSALNAVIQGSEGSIVKTQLIKVYEAREQLGLTLRVTVHDEVNGDTQNPDCEKDLKTVLETCNIPCRVPILWDVGSSPKNWGEAHS